MDECEALVDFLDERPLLNKKAGDFELWRRGGS